jgi:hypothetical protein
MEPETNKPTGSDTMKFESLAQAMVAVTFGIFVSTGVAHAGLFRTYLSLNGSDANACTLQAPCRLLPAALNAVNDGGEIWILDSANFNTATVAISKSVTILAVPGALGSAVAHGGHAIVVDAPSARVTLRNLVVLNLSGGTVGPSGFDGVRVLAGASVTIEDCEVYGMSARGMTVFASSNIAIAVKRSTFRDNGFRGLSFAGPVTLTMDGVHVLNSPLGVIVGPGLNATISNSVVANSSDAGNGVALKAQTDAAQTTRLAIENSVIRGSDVGLGVTSEGGAVAVTISRTSISQNATGVSTGISAGSAVAVLNASTVSHSTVAGVDTTQGGVVQSAGNNVFQFNTQNVTGTMTPWTTL